ncbi:MAG: chromate transporter, partial [Gemmatimonadaceae bacterium]
PLIQVVQFVAFLGAFRAPGDLHPLTAAILASVLVTWLTFVPSFLFILALGPYLETIGNNRRLAAALSGISAAVFGAILNLAVWFALHALFGDVREVAYGALHLTIPSWASLDWLALGIALAGLFALARLRVKHLGLILGAATFGAAVALLSD